MPTRFYVWTVFVIVVTLLPRLSNPTWPEIMGGLCINGVVLILPVYLLIVFNQWRRRRKQLANLDAQGAGDKG